MISSHFRILHENAAQAISTLKIGLRMALFGAADLPLFGLSLDLPGASSLVKDVSDAGSRLDQSI